MLSLLNGGVEGELAGVVEVMRLDARCDLTFGFAQQVGHALVGCCKSGRLRQCAECLHGLYALIEVQRRGRADGTHGLVHGDFNAFVFITRAQTVEDKVLHLRSQAVSFDLVSELGDGKGDGVCEIQIQLFLDQNTQHAECGTAQGVRVFAAGGQHADTEDADQGVQLVGQGHGSAGQGARQFGTGTARHVLLVQRQCHVFGFAVVLGVVVTSDALHFRELADHFTGQVALAENASAGGACCIAADALGNKAGQCRHTLCFVVDRTQLSLEHHIGQALVEGLQLLLLVLLEEELGVSQARTHHLLVTGNDLRRVFAFNVGHGDKARQQLAVAIEQAEVFLIVLHGGDQCFLRHFEEAFLE